MEGIKVNVQLPEGVTIEDLKNLAEKIDNSMVFYPRQLITKDSFSCTFTIDPELLNLISQNNSNGAK